jgi:hypothetical protein
MNLLADCGEAASNSGSNLRGIKVAGKGGRSPIRIQSRYRHPREIHELLGPGRGGNSVVR